MANTHIQQSGIPKQPSRCLGIPNNNYIKRSKKNKASENF